MGQEAFLIVAKKKLVIQSKISECEEGAYTSIARRQECPVQRWLVAEIAMNGSASTVHSLRSVDNFARFGWRF
jgi:hypothetical protein